MKFENCVLKKPPALEDRGRVLVVYAATQPENILSGYLDAALLTAKTLQQKNLNASEDVLALPFLNLCVNAIEFSTKFYIESILDHRLRKTCNCFGSPPDGYQKVLYGSHDLNKLIGIAKLIQPKVDMLHKPVGRFDEIETFIKSLMGFGIMSESTRYLTDSSRKKYVLYSDQCWIYPVEFQHAVSQLCDEFITAANSGDIAMCADGEFTRRREDELNEALTAMRANEVQFSVFRFDPKGLTQLPEVQSIPAGINMEDIARLIELRRILIAHLKALSENELVSLCMGLYFTRSPSQVENRKYFEQWSRTRLEDKIAERADGFDEAVSNLESHLAVISSLRKKRGLI